MARDQWRPHLLQVVSRLQSSEKRAREAKEWSSARVSLCSGVSGVCRCRSPFFLVAVVVRWNFKPRKKIRRLALDFRSTCAARRMTFRQGPQPTGQAHWWSNLRGTSGDPQGNAGDCRRAPGPSEARSSRGGPGTSTRGARRAVIGPRQLDLPCRGEAMGVMVNNLCSGGSTALVYATGQEVWNIEIPVSRSKFNSAS